MGDKDKTHHHLFPPPFTFGSQPTEDEEWQLQPDGGESVEQEGRHHASDVTQRGTDGHAQVPVFSYQQPTFSNYTASSRNPDALTTLMGQTPKLLPLRGTLQALHHKLYIISLLER